MRPLSFPHDAAVEQLAEQVHRIVAVAESLDDLRLLAPSRCHGWGALEVLVHVRSGLQEMALARVVPGETADHDAASYWQGHREASGADPVPGILWGRRLAGAYTRPRDAVRHLSDVADAAVAAARAMPEGCVRFQGQRLLTGDFLATWVVELAVHHLDLDLDEDDVPNGLTWTRATLEALAEAALPSDLDDRQAVLVGLGRVACPAGMRLPDSFPVRL